MSSLASPRDTTDGGGGAAGRNPGRVFEYQITSADPKKGGPSKEDMARISALFPPSTLPGLAAHLQTLMRKPAADAMGKPVSVQPDAMLGGTKRVASFRAHYLIYWLLATKDKGLEAISCEKDAIALAQLLLSSKSPQCVAACRLPLAACRLRAAKARAPLPFFFSRAPHARGPRPLALQAHWALLAHTEP